MPPSPSNHVQSRAKTQTLGIQSFDDLLAVGHHTQTNDTSGSSSSVTIVPTLKGGQNGRGDTDEGLEHQQGSDEDRGVGRARDGRASHESQPQLSVSSQSYSMRTMKWLRKRGAIAASLFARITTKEPEDSRDVDERSDNTAVIEGSRLLSTSKLILLTLSITGAQLAWTLQLSYGTPFLMSLGLSKQGTSLVWLAGPMAGLIVQPVVGSLSDASTSSFRRRKYMIASAALLALSTVALAFSQPVARALVDFLGIGLGDWDPVRHEAAHSMTQILAVTAFWVLDFSLNGLQSASRALILDTVPVEQQSTANAWHGRMTHAGNILGYTAGWANLSQSPLLRWIGGTQFHKLSLLSLTGMTICVGTTCFAIKEKESTYRDASSTSASVSATLRNIGNTIRRLPRPVRRVCLVQLAAFSGWFPFLFYATTYLIEVRVAERKNQMPNFSVLKKHTDEDQEKATFSMLLYAITALVAGTFVPYLALAGDRFSGPPTLTDRNRPARSQTRWKFVFAAIRRGVSLRTIWTFSSLFFAVLMMSTFIVKSSVHATAIVALSGVSWAVASWVPFAMVMDFVQEAEHGASPFEFDTDHFSRTRTAQRRRESSGAGAPGGVARDSAGSVLARGELVHGEGGQPVETGGTILGIHNLSIVVPQFWTAIFAALIFRAVEEPDAVSVAAVSVRNSGTAWVLRYGGVAALVGAFLTRLIPLTRTERMRRGESVLPPLFDDEEGDEEE